MIDIHKLRENPEHVGGLIKRKDPRFDVKHLLELDEAVRSIRAEVESLRKDKNDLSSLGGDGLNDKIRERSIEIGRSLKDREKELHVAVQAFEKLALTCPNVPIEGIPLGGKEHNAVIRTIGQKPHFSFEPRNHVELNANVGWFDMEAAARISGGQFVLYKGDGVRMMYALTRMMIKNNAAAGFEPIIPPYLVERKTMFNASNLPKFDGDFYEVQDGMCLIPTSEVPLTSIHADQILNDDQLPIRYTAWTSCFRREAGGYGSLERGLIRIHQFEKVEIFSACRPEESQIEQERMVLCAERLLQQLGLHYQVSLLAAQDCSFASAKTYDIEVWLPGQNKYYEVSSASDCTDFQARRAAIRYRESATAKPKLVHTLNASSLALPRLMVAIMETFQQEDGTIVLPEVLQQAMNEAW